ncbi:MAG TPA: hypothetical protein VLG92_01360 [Candidatus Saccharimonadia bacterium]|nr:hypothetical protein [Candidatus Saccharimonadia bacterium]
MSETTVVLEPFYADDPDEEALRTLRELSVDYVPSDASVGALHEADLVLMAGQFVGAGKSTFIKDLTTQQGRENVPSWTNRELRQGELEGIDKSKRSLPAIARAATEGSLLEFVEVRPGIFYATPALFTPGREYVKDVELQGALRLREIAPELRIVVPLPPLDPVESLQVTEWERRVVERDIRGGVTARAIDDLEQRLKGAAEEATRIQELDLVDDPRTFFVVNRSLPEAVLAMNVFLQTGEKTQQDGIRAHIKQLGSLASAAISAH